MADQLRLTVKRCLERYRFFTNQQPLVVAVSTGVDSMVLLTLLQKLVPVERIVVAHVNHHLREQSREEERYLRDYCQGHHLRLFVDQWVVEDHPQTGIEMAARQERYRFFREVLAKEGAQLLLTAHHENDLAETMLMKLLRTGELSELVGIKEARHLGSATVLHPLLRIPKQQLVDYARQHQIHWFEDASNQADATLRNRIRHHYLPELASENPQILDHLLKLHDQLTSLLDWQEQTLDDEMWVDPKGKLQLTSYQKYQPTIRQLLLRDYFNHSAIYDVTTAQLTQLDHFLMNRQRPQGQVTVNANWLLIKNYQIAELKKVQNLTRNDSSVADFMVKFDHWYSGTDGYQYGVFTTPVAQVEATILLTPEQQPLRVRQWQPGDRLRLKSGHHQLVRRILIDQKVPLNLRQQEVVMVDHLGQVLWLIGHKTAWLDRYAAHDHHQQVYFCRKAVTGENNE
ncbi:tRNA lysidine(34) synthetase TilS [Limosilactobacillus caecicola]|uniref:tRNA lysidine(34) synthetase TilS n=1 Tax=Limosilactobacillus caecicola TaxID=2941332 RepID=UPI00203C5423|nr:tRNA lysidine(34) synthetase TilS [Limosilactobacillus caecicola]